MLHLLDTDTVIYILKRRPPAVAAHALSLRATLVTNNTREFRRVRGLKLENWVGS